MYIEQIEGKMTEQRTTDLEVTVTRRLQQKRRVKRGIVAGYIHELSGRHNDAREEPAVLDEELVEQTQGD